MRRAAFQLAVLAILLLASVAGAGTVTIGVGAGDCRPQAVGALTYGAAPTCLTATATPTSTPTPTATNTPTPTATPIALPLSLANGGTHADLSGTGGTSRVLKQVSTGADITVAQLAASDLSNGTTGSNSVVLATSPTITTPTINTQSSAAGTTEALSATAPAAVASTTAGSAVTIAASNATAGTTNAGAAVGGTITFTAGDAAQKTSGNALGGGFTFNEGSGVGSGAASNPGTFLITSTGVVSGHGETTFQLNSASNVPLTITNDTVSTFTASNLTFSAEGGLNTLTMDNSTGKAVFLNNGGTVVNNGSASVNPLTVQDNGTPIFTVVDGGNTVLGTSAGVAAPTGRTLACEPSRGGTDSNTSGASCTIQAGTGTGSASPSVVYLDAPQLGTGSGSTAQTQTHRFVAGAAKTLTNNSTTTIVSATLANDTSIALHFSWAVEGFDGTDQQIRTGDTICRINNKGGTITNNICTDLVSLYSTSNGGGATMAVTLTITAANPALVQINANSTLTQSAGYERLTFELHNLTSQAVALQ